MKPHALLMYQKVLYFWWKYFAKRTCRVWVGSKGYVLKKVACPLVYYRKDGRSIAIDLYFMLGGFYCNRLSDEDVTVSTKNTRLLTMTELA